MRRCKLCADLCDGPICDACAADDDANRCACCGNESDDYLCRECAEATAADRRIKEGKEE